MKHLSKLFTAGATLLSLVGCSIDVPYQNIPFQGYHYENADGRYNCIFDENPQRERVRRAPLVSAECDPHDLIIGERYDIVVDSSALGDKVVSIKVSDGRK